MADYGFKTTARGSFDAVAARTKEALAAEGFGILTTIDVHAKMQEKLGKEMPKHLILGACNPPKAYEALAAEHDIGLLLPCNVVLYEGDGFTPGSERGDVTVTAIRPAVAMGMIRNERLAAIAADVERRLGRVIEAIGAQRSAEAKKPADAQQLAAAKGPAGRKQ